MDQLSSTAIVVDENGDTKRVTSDLISGSTENALVLQRKQRLQSIVHKRKENLKYIMKAHQGGVYWLNCILLTKEIIAKHVLQTSPKHRTLMYFYLAASTSNILSLPRGAATVKAFQQLLEEWEYNFAGAAMQSMKFVLARNSPCIFPLSCSGAHVGNSTGIEENEGFKPPSMSKFDNLVVYEHLQITYVPFELDYVEVLVGLCDSIIALYGRFLSKECYM
jgi:hypothetical protein